MDRKIKTEKSEKSSYPTFVHTYILCYHDQSLYNNFRWLHDDDDYADGDGEVNVYVDADDAVANTRRY